MPEERVTTHATQANYEKAIEGLGTICVEFQRLKSHLKTAITLLLSPEDAQLGTIVTAQLSFKATLDLLYAPHHYRFADDLRIGLKTSKTI